ncbi:MAG: hypothetical protein ACFFDF_15990 [Candidatus Odinarchaeota archaeon]
MNSLDEVLLKDERILWSYQNKKDLLKSPIQYIFLGIIVYCIGFSIILILSFLLNMIALLISYGVFLTIGFFFWTYYRYRDYLEIQNDLNSSKEELKNYKEEIYLTNKRWIQKSDLVFKIDLKRYPVHQIKGDIILINYNDIKSLVTVEIQEKNQYYIGISGTYQKKIDVFNILGFYLPTDMYNDLFNILNQNMYLEIEEVLSNNIKKYIQRETI